MHLTRRTLISVSLSITLALASSATAFAASPAPAKGEHGMVVTAQHLATDVGVEVLKRGGNAIDAAVAVGYALAVVYPNAGNIGGGGFMTVRMKDGRTTFIDFRERAPLAATRTMYLDKAGNPVKGASLDGYLAVGVPGSVAGFEMVREKYGTLSRQDLIAPAIAFARDGFVLNQGDAASFADSASRLAKDPAAAAIFLKKDGKPYGMGEKLVQPDLAASLSAISEKGPDAFYKGAIANAIVRASGAKGGILAKEDFEQYAVRELKPVTCSYRGYEIVSSPPPSSGGAIICEILNVIEGYPMSYLGAGSAETVHVMVEAMRRAYVDRNSALGDPDFVDNPVSKLLDKGYAKEIRDRIDPFRAGISKDLMPKGFGESTETTHYSIIDDEGNAVAVTYTLNGSFGTGKVAGGTGILLNNEMDDFALKPGTPNAFGVMGYEANAPKPGKRMLSSMTPTFMENADKVIVIGTPGGSRIITMVLLGILGYDAGLDAQQVAALPRYHHQWLPDEISAESGAFTPEVARQLQAMGHKVDLPGDSAEGGRGSSHVWGNLQTVEWDRRSNTLSGGSDPRNPVGSAEVRKMGKGD